MTKLIISTSEFQSQVADLLPCNNYRKSQLTHALINSYSLLDGFDEVIQKPISFEKDMLQFHSAAYIKSLLNEKLNTVLPFDRDQAKCSQLAEMASLWRNKDADDQCHSSFDPRSKLYELFKKMIQERRDWRKKRSAFEALLDDDEGEDLNNEENTEETKEDKCQEGTQFNLEGDCPLFSFLPMYCQVITGATLILADHVKKGERSIAVNWDGGRHHGFKQRASGFCYVNDIVLLIQKLRRNGFQKVSYVDFDLHHGDGVEKAFQFASNVQTISTHMYEVGFFPGTGSLDDSKKGKNVVNLPLRHGLDDDLLSKLTQNVIIPIIKRHDPNVLVIQCGGDGLIGDGYKEWQLTIRGLVKNITELINVVKDHPIILLGGGGYNDTLMSRFYTYLTWKVAKEHSSNPLAVCDIEGDALIPEHEFTDIYAEEHYKFWIYEQEGSLRRKNLRNENNENIIELFKSHYNI